MDRFILLRLSSGVFGQYIQKETVGGTTYAVIYSEGLAGAAQWGPE